MKRRWLVSTLVALCACGGASSADRDLSDLSDSGDTVEPSDAADSDASDEETLEVAVTAPVDPLGRCESTPAASFGRVAWMDGDTLFAKRPSEAGPAQPLFTSTHPGLRRPVIALGREYHPTAAAFVVTSATPDISTIEILDHQGNLHSSLDLPGVALPPLAGKTHLVVPLAAESSSIQWVSLATGAPGHTLPLAAAPTTPAAPFGPALLSGGGSHWVVGTESGLLAVADRYLNRRLEDGPIDPLVTEDLPTITGEHALDGTPRALVVLGDRLVVHLERGSTHHLQLFRIELLPDQTTFIPLGSTALPSAPTAAPVGVDCQLAATDPAYCPKFEVATVVIGGEGWLRAYHLGTGASVTLSNEPITWTGLALGRGGWVAGGGSHWLPAEPAPTPGLWLHHPLLGSEPLLLGAANEAALSLCVPSPVWDHGGQLALPFEDELRLIELAGTFPSISVTGPLGPASGPARPVGDNKNSGAPLDASACEDGTSRTLVALPIDSSAVFGVRLVPPMVLVFGVLDELPFFRWFAPPEQRWYMDPLTIPDAAFIAQAEVLGDGELALVLLDRSGQQLLERYTSYRTFLHRTNIGRDGLGRSILGLVPQGDGLHLIAESPATLALVRELDGRLDEVEFGDTANAELRLLPPRQGTLGGGAVMVVVDGGRVTLRRVDAALEEIAAVTDSSLTSPRLIAATTDGRGEVRLLLEDGEDTWLWRYDEALDRVDARRVPLSTSLLTGATGESLLIRPDGLARVSVDGALGLPRPHPFLSAGDTPGGGAVPQGFTLALSTPDHLLLATVDVLGGSGCLEAGACVGSRMLACDFVDPCLAVGCEPTTGDCREEPAGICGP